MEPDISVGIELINATKWNALAKICNYLFYFIAAIVLARFLTSEEFGLAAIALTSTALFRLPGRIGFDQSIIGLKNVNKKLVDTLFTIQLIIAIILYSILLFSAEYIANFYKMPGLDLLIQVAGLGIFFGIVFSIPNALLQRLLKYKEQSFSTVTTSLISGVLSIVMAITGFGIWTLIIPELISTFIGGIIAFKLSHYLPSITFNLKYLNKSLNFGLSAFSSNIFNFFCNKSVILVMGTVWSTSVLGGFTFIQTKVTKSFELLTGYFLQPVFPICSKFYDARASIRRIYLRILRFAIFCLVPIYTILIVGAQQLISFIFGDQWNFTVLPFQILCVLQIVQCFSSLGVNSILYALKLPHVSAKISVYRIILYFIFISLGYFYRFNLIYMIITITIIDIFVALIYLHVCLLKINSTYSEYLSFIKAPLVINLFSTIIFITSQLFLNISYVSDIFSLVISSILFLYIFVLLGQRMLIRELSLLPKHT